MFLLQYRAVRVTLLYSQLAGALPAVQKKREAGGSEQGTSRSVCCSGRWWQPCLVPSNGQGTLFASRTALLWREGQGTAQSDCKMCCWQQQALSKPSPGDWVCFLLIGDFLATFSAIKNNKKSTLSKPCSSCLESQLNVLEFSKTCRSQASFFLGSLLRAHLGSPVHFALCF